MPKVQKKVQEFENAKNTFENDFYNGKGIYVPDSILNDEDDELNIGNNAKIVAYKFSESGKNYLMMIKEMDEFLEEYEKDFETNEEQQNDINGKHPKTDAIVSDRSKE